MPLRDENLSCCTANLQALSHKLAGVSSRTRTTGYCQLLGYCGIIEKEKGTRRLQRSQSRTRWHTIQRLTGSQSAAQYLPRERHLVDAGDVCRFSGCTTVRGDRRIDRRCDMAVVTISRQFGCGGREGSREGVRSAGIQLLRQGSHGGGSHQRRPVRKRCGRLLLRTNYRVKGFWERLFGRGPRTVFEHETGRVDTSEEAMLTAETLDESQCILFVREHYPRRLPEGQTWSYWAEERRPC